MSAVLKQPKQKLCRAPGCEVHFVPFRSTQKACSPKCALAISRAALAKQDRKARRAGLVKLRTVRDWTKLAQAEFNRYVRARDADKPCISCGELSPLQLHGGVWDCGHFRSVGACPELRFEELNAHRQCKDCNSNTRRGGRYVMPVERAMSIRDAYRANLVARIGPEKVEWLEGPHEPKRYRIDELIAIRDLYRQKWRELRA